ncbi:hypothetical protein GLOTRDRAFT_129388 [Gloeophyllum trabeum ATCC 11539]|uniref:Uncharacterized protein n=1 Tax=Gloeophyllum trabeum (strain ATCC 11539 / FP-39264 / Madison 617) TaxID=670483 RepID=S7Q6F9_GLOTA|nr:uncharacterized protein GLOTRDRAFT_129388 [Gloeophyllum trabeum ATCC 11539]EPQ55097.1 hypothetical protein GLOTRDRAFT_129388 [Gloeophyllum trabeum ATCC 11539]
MPRRKSARSQFTAEEEGHVSRIFQWDLAVKQHTYCHAQAGVTSEENAQAHAEGKRLLQQTEPYKLWANGGNHVYHMSELPPEYFEVADFAATVPATPTQNPAERWMLVIVLLYAIQAYGKAIDDRFLRLTHEAGDRSRDLLIKRGMWDTTRFFNRPSGAGASAQPTSKVGPHLLLRRVRLTDDQTYEVADYIHSAMNGASYVLHPRTEGRDLLLDEASFEEQLVEILPQVY